MFRETLQSACGFQPNPDYGQGAYRRAIRLTNRGGEIRGALEDTFHAIRCRIVHEGSAVAQISAEFIRWPLTTCPGAVEPIKKLVGTPLNCTAAELLSGGVARKNCTHIYDLAIMMLLHHRRGEGVWRYDVVVPDNITDSPSVAQLYRDGNVLLEWRVSGDTILSPEPYAGRRVISGFSRWATQTLDDDVLGPALILQKGYWQSDGRRYLIGKDRMHVSHSENELKGACFSFSSPQFEQAIRLDSRRDFPESGDLLTFAPFDPEG